MTWEVRPGGKGIVSPSHQIVNITNGMTAYFVSYSISRLEVQYSPYEVLAGNFDKQIRCSVNTELPIVLSAVVDFTCKF